MSFYTLKIFWNGVKHLDLGSDTNDSLDIILDRITSNLKLKEETFYRFNIYEGAIVVGKGIYCTQTGNLDLSTTSKQFQHCFERGKKYSIFIAEVSDKLTVISINNKLMQLYIEGKQGFIDWIYTYRFNVEQIIVNQTSFSELDLEEIKDALNEKINYVFIKIK